MRIGVPRERKDGERRVGLLPEGVAALAELGHVVLVECGAGERVGFDDASYAVAGAQVSPMLRKFFRRRAHRQGQGTPAQRMAVAATGHRRFWFCAIRPRSRIARCRARCGHRLHRLRDRRRGRRDAALLAPMSRIAEPTCTAHCCIHADERSRRQRRFCCPDSMASRPGGWSLSVRVTSVAKPLA